MPFIITRDGKPTYGRYNTDLDVLGELHKRVPYSADHALTHEGYGILEVPADRWSALEARDLRRTAIRMMTDHMCNGSRSIDMRENCQACCLHGYQPRDRHHRDYDVNVTGPNVSNWQRDYVQAGYAVKARWVTPFIHELLFSDNEPWKACLRLDIATFGVRGGSIQRALAEHGIDYTGCL